METDRMPQKACGWTEPIRIRKAAIKCSEGKSLTFSLDLEPLGDCVIV